MHKLCLFSFNIIVIKWCICVIVSYIYISNLYHIYTYISLYPMYIIKYIMTFLRLYTEIQCIVYTTLFIIFMIITLSMYYVRFTLYFPVPIIHIVHCIQYTICLLQCIQLQYNMYYTHTMYNTVCICTIDSKDPYHEAMRITCT